MSKVLGNKGHGLQIRAGGEEKILYELKDEVLGIQALKVAEKTIKYGVTKNK